LIAAGRRTQREEDGYKMGMIVKIRKIGMTEMTGMRGKWK
jgi:hypothetical protein